MGERILSILIGKKLEGYNIFKDSIELHFSDGYKANIMTESGCAIIYGVNE